MLDIKWIRENKEEFNDLLLKRGVEVNTEEIIKLDEEKRQLITLIQEFQQAKKIRNQKNSLV